VQSVVKNALKLAKIKKKAHPHTLRSSYATHLIENGTDISYVQKLLGHSSIKTTQGYLRLGADAIRSIKSPLD
jgi:site-specific recombinase XerD